MTETLDGIKRTILDHEKRISELEKTILEKKIKPEQKPKLKGLPDRILALRASNFFSEPRTVAEVHTEIVKTYPCDLNRVSVALFRLSKKKELRRTTKAGEDKEHVSYAW